MAKQNKNTENIFCLPIHIKMRLLIFLFFFQSNAKQEEHYLHYLFTVKTKTDAFPICSAVGESDDKQIAHYSTEKRVWVRKNLTDWAEAPEPPETREQFLNLLYNLSKCTPSAECPELHVLQRIIGCELEKLPDGTVTSLKPVNVYGYDGSYLYFNSDTVQWIDKRTKAKETKEEWDRQTEQNRVLKNFFKNCIDWILKFNNTIKSSPDVHVSARKVPSYRNKLVLTCLATGFYPRDIEMYIRLNRTVLEDQTSSGIRPNDDETFQMRISVKIDRNLRGPYDCLIIHSNLTVTVEWDGKCSNCELEHRWDVIGGVTAVLGLVLVIVIGYLIYKRKSSNGLMTWRRNYGSMENQSQNDQSEDDQLQNDQSQDDQSQNDQSEDDQLQNDQSQDDQLQNDQSEDDQLQNDQSQDDQLQNNYFTL